MTTITTATVDATIGKLTAKGAATMAAVGGGKMSFFDEGIVAGSGTWGFCFTNELGHKSSGVANQLAKLGLFDKGYDEEEGDTWFALTELGALVALACAGETLPVAAPAKPAAAPATTMKVCGKWTRFILDGVEVGRIRNDQVQVARSLMLHHA